MPIDDRRREVGDLDVQILRRLAEQGERLVALLSTVSDAGATVLADGSVELPVADDAALDAVVSAIADAGLPLHALSSRRASLDGLFLGEAAP